jgi:N-acetylneuraminate synthase
MSERVHICAEAGINHNGDYGLAERLIVAAKEAGADSVKFQKRVPELDVPKAMWDTPKATPKGIMSYINYKKWIEFTLDEYHDLWIYARKVGIPIFWSVWGLEALEELHGTGFRPFTWKVPSAKITDVRLLQKLATLQAPIIISTGGSTITQAANAAAELWNTDFTICHCNSTYPCPKEDLNLRYITTMKRDYPRNKYGPIRIGYSGHEVGLATTLAAVALGATYIERHLTLDRSMWGSDQASSIEPNGFKRLVDDIRSIEVAMGDGVKRVTEAEEAVMGRLRG